MPDLLCLSHLRWQFVFQRPQHLMTRAARDRRVFYVEEPEFHDAPARLRVELRDGVHVATPLLPLGSTEAETVAAQRELLQELCLDYDIVPEVLWFYTPMALTFAADLRARITVFDCMDQLANFRNADPRIEAFEADLLARADVVFTGGRSLYEVRRARHDNVHLLPSSVDVKHFARARLFSTDPPDQAAITHPRLGFFGVIDERFDVDLVAQVAAAASDLQFVFLGPTAKIDAADLPQLPNIHWLGPKTYAELPAYLAGWAVALMPFALNESTRFISPTKTPEYLAAGRPIVSTSVPDVVAEYAESGLVHFGDTPEAFLAAIDRALTTNRLATYASADAALRGKSWDHTWSQMDAHIRTALDATTELRVFPVAPSIPDRSRASRRSPRT